MPVFVDMNVLVHARDASAGDRHDRSRAWLAHLWRSRTGRLSQQVLHEYYAVVTRKLDPGLPRDETRADVRDLLAWRPAALDIGVLEGAWRIEDRFGLSFWDALIVSAARATGCERLLTEDLLDGREIEGVVIMDPFAHDPPGRADSDR